MTTYVAIDKADLQHLLDIVQRAKEHIALFQPKDSRFPDEEERAIFQAKQTLAGMGADDLVYVNVGGKIYPADAMPPTDESVMCLGSPEAVGAVRQALHRFDEVLPVLVTAVEQAELDQGPSGETLTAALTKAKEMMARA